MNKIWKIKRISDNYERVTKKRNNDELKLMKITKKILKANEINSYFSITRILLINKKKKKIMSCKKFYISRSKRMLVEERNGFSNF
jgi:hypothetical protein